MVTTPSFDATSDAFFKKTIRRFRVRNKTALAQLQLQHGKVEHWFARELSLAMNDVLGWPRDTRFAECEVERRDISIWEAPSTESKPTPVAFFEVKTLCSSREVSQWQGIVEKAWAQTHASPKSLFGGLPSLGIFLLAFDLEARDAPTEKASAFFEKILTKIEPSFDVCGEFALARLSSQQFGSMRWWTTSKVVWAKPRV